MWPHRRMEQLISPVREMPEVERTQNQPSPANTQGHDDYSVFSDVEIDSDDEAFHNPASPVDLLLFTSIETYNSSLFEQTEEQALSGSHGMLYMCRVLSVRSTEMAESTSCLTPQSPYPHIMYYSSSSERTSTPVRSIIDDQPSRLSGDDDLHSLSPMGDDRRSEDENLSLNSTLSTLSRDISIRSISSISSDVIAPASHSVRNKTIINKGIRTPEPIQSRQRVRSVPKMPLASNVATQVANRVIKYARCIRNLHEKDMCCLNCGLFPICPVTGPCGHTRCTACIQDKNTCPCGHTSPDTLFVNILIRDLIGKTTSDGQSSRIVSMASSSTDDNPVGASSGTTGISDLPRSNARASCAGPIRHKHKTRCSIVTPSSSCYQRIPMSPRARYNHALELLQAGIPRMAAPHLALAAASYQPDLRQARTLLAQVITVLSKKRDPRRLTRQLNGLVRHLSSTSWIKPTDMECILCSDTFTNPVTTPCGHMFCRTCIERTLDYRKRCPLCLRPLNDFNLRATHNTVFVQAALKSINAINAPPVLEPDFIPIFVCTVAYPSVPCPLFIFDPRYWLMIRRVLESGSRRFGMVACDRGQDYVDFGTILEVRDCVHLEDGRSILSTIGRSRFKVIERGVRDGCEVARILPITDVNPIDDMEVWDLKMLGSKVMFKALLWLGRLNNKVLEDIETAFGRLPPRGGSDEEWWESTDGPTWLWWLVAVLPLRSEIKVLILSTDCLLKRMMAVSRTLEAVDQVTLTTSSPSECEIQNPVTANNQTMQGAP